MGVCNCSMFCCTLLYVHSSIAVILMGKRELFALLGLSSWCLVVVGRLFLAVPRGCLQFVIVVFPDHTHLLFFSIPNLYIQIRNVNATCILRSSKIFLCATKTLENIYNPRTSVHCSLVVWPMFFSLIIADV